MDYRLKILGAALGLGIALAPIAGCSEPAPPVGAHATGALSGADDISLDALTSYDVRDLVDELERMPRAERPSFMASVRASELLLEVGGQEASLPLPEDEFYVSIAPYVEQTHECTYHSLTTCVGELPGAELHVEVTDDSGAVVVDEDLVTHDNGFFGLWLPRGLDGTITITHADGHVTAPLSTGQGDPTCITNLRLVP